MQKEEKKSRDLKIQFDKKQEEVKMQSLRAANLETQVENLKKSVKETSTQFNKMRGGYLFFLFVDCLLISFLFFFSL